MPQGPISRGCEACRAQKKKCDLAKPACSRCAKLHITCVGSGQQRFKFLIDETTALIKHPPKAVPSPARTPSNETTILQQAMIATLPPLDDIRFSIVFVHGRFLLDIPRRLGTNQALDASVAALLARHSERCMRMDQTDHRSPAVTTYYRALAALRMTLDDPIQSSTSETLCAVMLLTYCQSRFDDQFTYFWSPHARGIAQLVRIHNFASGTNEFERYLFGAINIALLLQSFANSDVRLSVEEYQKLDAALIRGGGSAQNVYQWRLMLRISEFMARARLAIVHNSSPQDIMLEARELDKSIRILLDGLRKKRREIEAQFYQGRVGVKIYVGYQRALGFTLAAHAILLCARRTLDPTDPLLEATAANLCFEVLRMAYDVQVYRPLGALWTVHVLICACCATQDPALKMSLVDALLDYHRYAMGPNATVRIDQLKRLEQRLSLVA